MVRLRRVPGLQLLPRPDRLFACGALLGGQKVAQEIEVTHVRNLRESPSGLVESNVFLNQVSVRQLHSLGEPLFAPAIETVANARSSRQTRNTLLRLALEKRLRFFVVCKTYHVELEVQTSFHVLDTGGRQVPRGWVPGLACHQEGPDCLLELVL